MNTAEIEPPIEDESPTSPIPAIVVNEATVSEVERELHTFPDIIRMVVDGKKIAKKEWDDGMTAQSGFYGFMEEGKLYLHKPEDKEGDKHPWILSDGDIMGDDWYIL